MKYVVICEDKTCDLFPSLREISKKIHINYSTISKNLKDEGKCFCTSKITKKQYTGDYCNLICDLSQYTF